MSAEAALQAKRAALRDKYRKLFTIEEPTRRMVFPYTFSAKLSQFPWRWHWHNSRMARRMTLVSFPIAFYIFYKINQIADNDLCRAAMERNIQRCKHNRFQPVKPIE